MAESSTHPLLYSSTFFYAANAKFSGVFSRRVSQ